MSFAVATEKIQCGDLVKGFSFTVRMDLGNRIQLKPFLSGPRRLLTPTFRAFLTSGTRLTASSSGLVASAVRNANLGIGRDCSKASKAIRIGLPPGNCATPNYSSSMTLGPSTTRQNLVSVNSMKCLNAGSATGRSSRPTLRQICGKKSLSAGSPAGFCATLPMCR